MKYIKKIELKVKRQKLSEARAPYNKKVTNPDEAAQIAQSILEGEDQEVFLTLLLDVQNRVIGYSEISRGAIDACPVDMRALFRTAILQGVTSLMTVHNHPSGEVTPSSEDRAIFARIEKCGKILGIVILDHLIVSDDDFYSVQMDGPPIREDDFE